jgi:tetratricopeptide (TPR) repeat protein
MTMTLAHPAAEDLGRFVEGTLDDPSRVAVVAHIADCDECRVVVVDSAEFVEPVVAQSNRRLWLPVAASVAVLFGSTFIWNARRDPLTPVIDASAHLTKRPLEARLSGFQYLNWSTMRSGNRSEPELAELELDGKIAEVLERRGDDPKTLHAKGVALLLAAAIETTDKPSETLDKRERAVQALRAAATALRNPKYESDLAAAMIVSGKQDQLESAVRICDEALRIDSRSREALFNRALALEALSRREASGREAIDRNQSLKAIAAYDRYLTVDSSSPWANDARNNRERVQLSLALP